LAIVTERFPSDRDLNSPATWELRLIGHTGNVTLGQVWRLYQQHRLPLVTARRTRNAKVVMSHVLAHLGDRFPVTDLLQSHVDSFAAKRKSGELGEKRRPVEVRAVRDGTASPVSSPGWHRCSTSRAGAA
jgi:hypothetical protein